MRKIEVLKDTPSEFELGDMADDIQRRSEERQQTGKEEEAHKQQREEREEARRAKTPLSHTEEGVAKKTKD